MATIHQYNGGGTVNGYNRKRPGEMTRYSSGYSGTDIVAVFRFPDLLGHKPMVFGELRTVAYSTYSDKFPVRSLGMMNPKGFTRASRTVGGTLVFAILNQPMIRRFFNEYYNVDDNIVPDELPPFCIDITMANELGDRARKSIIGVEFTESSQIMSAEELHVDEQYSFVAQSVVQ